MAWHEEANSSIPDHAIIKLGLMAEVVHHVNDTTLVNSADVCGDIDVDSQAQNEKRKSEVRPWQRERSEKVGERFRSQHVKDWQHRVDEAHLLVRDHAECKHCRDDHECKDAQCLALRVSRKLWAVKLGSESRPQTDRGKRKSRGKEQWQAFCEVVVHSVPSVEGSQILHDVQVQEAHWRYCPFAVEALVDKK